MRIYHKNWTTSEGDGGVCISLVGNLLTLRCERRYTFNIGYRVCFLILSAGGIPCDIFNEKMCHGSKKVEKHCPTERSPDPPSPSKIAEGTIFFIIHFRDFGTKKKM